MKMVEFVFKKKKKISPQKDFPLKSNDNKVTFKNKLPISKMFMFFQIVA